MKGTQELGVKSRAPGVMGGEAPTMDVSPGDRRVRPTAYRSVMNALRIAGAHAIIAGIFYPWRACEKLLRRSLGNVAHCHHVILDVLRLAGATWPVTVSYPNIMSPGKRLRLELDLCHTTQLWYFRNHGRSGEDWIRLMAPALQDADCFVDVGAHLGLYAMTLAQAYPGKRVVAVEPDPGNYAALRRHLTQNHLERVEATPCAIAANGERATYFRNPLNDGGGGLRPVEEYRSGERRVNAADYLMRHPSFSPQVTVSCRRLDAMVGEPCVMKIDVEGSELDVLRSAEGLFAERHVRLLVVEVWEEALRQVLEYLVRFEMEVWLPGRGQPLRVGDSCGRRIANLIALPRACQGYDQIVAMLRNQASG